jgi:hypothetical protein
LTRKTRKHNVLTRFLQIPGRLHEACREWEDTVSNFVAFLRIHPDQDELPDGSDQQAVLDVWNFEQFKAQHKLNNSSSRLSDPEADLTDAPEVSSPYPFLGLANYDVGIPGCLHSGCQLDQQHHPGNSGRRDGRCFVF